MAEQENPMEGRTMLRPDRTRREGRKESREKTPTEAYNWDRLVDRIQTLFG